MLGKGREQRRAVGQLEVGEVEPGRHGTADERVGAGVVDGGAVPAPLRDDGLKCLAPLGIGAEPQGVEPTVGMDERQCQRGTRVEVPDLVRLDPMQRRDLIAGDQEVDRRRVRARKRTP